MSNTPANPVVFASGNKDSKPAFFQKIRPPFSKLNFKKTGIAGLVVLLVFALVLGVYLSRRPTQLKPQATGEEVSLSIRPADTAAALNQEFNLDVFFDPAGQTNFEITTIQAKINYDPQLLELKEVVIKDFLPVFQPPVNTSGSTIFSVASVNPKQGSGVIATLTFKALTASGGPAQVSFDQTQTQVYEISHDDAIAAALTPGTVTFGAQSSGSPSPTPSSGPKTSLSLEALTSGPVPPGAQFQVKVLTRSDIENANLWNATINFPKNLVEAVSVDKTGSVISSWSSESLDNNTGQIQLVGGVPTPGYKTTSGNALVATLTFKAKSAGTANLAFDTQSAIYSNANNTNILQEKNGISVSIADEVIGSPSPSPSASASPSPSPSASASPSPSPSGSAGKGDGNNDGKVDLADLSIMFSKWSPATDITSHFKLDFNDDLRINSLDFSAMNQLLLSLGIIRQ